MRRRRGPFHADSLNRVKTELFSEHIIHLSRQEKMTARHHKDIIWTCPGFSRVNLLLYEYALFLASRQANNCGQLLPGGRQKVSGIEIVATTRTLSAVTIVRLTDDYREGSGNDGSWR